MGGFAAMPRVVTGGAGPGGGGPLRAHGAHGARGEPWGCEVEVASLGHGTGGGVLL